MATVCNKTFFFYNICLFVLCEHLFLIFTTLKFKIHQCVYYDCEHSSIFLNVINLKLDVCGSVHHSTINKEKSNKMQQCIKILLFHIYMKLNMFRATHRPSSGA